MIRFVEFEESYIEQMADLLAARHVEERKKFPFLPERYENQREAMKIIIDVAKRPYAAGLVVLRGDEVIGYLLYEYKQNETRGRYVEIDYPSLVIKKSEHPRLVRLMYAEAGAEWVRHGYFEHIIFTSVGNDPVILELLEQSFRFNQRYALLPLKTYSPKSDGATNVTVRNVTGNDTSLLRKMAHWNSLHQAAAPSWNPITKETLDEVRKSYGELAEDPEVKMWIAEQNSIPAAFHVYFPANSYGSMITPEKAANLPAGSTNPELRGRGIGKTMADYCFNEMKELGYEYVLADWHTPNHLASYFWPKLGFQTYMIRMIRTVDPRISWADGV